MLTERDRHILAEVARFGFLQADQIRRVVSRERNVSKRMVYHILNRLEEQGYLKRRRVLVGLPGLYLPTERGLEAADSDFARTRVRLQTVEHDLTVIDVALALTARTGGAWVTERELRREAGQRFGVGHQGHVPDGVLVLPDGRRVAVEVETSAKTLRRLQVLLRNYLRTRYAEVWFICRTARQAHKVRQAARGMDFVRVMELREVLRDDGPGAVAAQKEAADSDHDDEL